MRTISRCALVVALALALPAHALADWECAITPGKVVWRGYLHGAAPDVDRVALTPAGDGVLYYQGAPWPRLMLQPVAEPTSASTAATMLGVSAPLDARPPLVDRQKRVWFTIDAAWKPGRRRRDVGSRPVEPVVSRIRLDGRGEERLLPGAILLDIHPGASETALVGLVGPLTQERVRIGDFSLRLAELVDGDAPRAFGLEIRGSALARYSTDGKRIFAERPESEGGATTIVEIDRRAGLRRRIELTPDRCGRRAGDLVISTSPAVVPGAPGSPAPLRLELSMGVGQPSVPLVVPADFPGTGPTHIRDLLADRALLTRGGSIAQCVVVELARAEIARAARASAADDVAARSRTLFRADATGAARRILNQVREAMGSSTAPPAERIRVRYREEGRGSTGAVTVDVRAAAAGALRVERSTPPEHPADAPARERVEIDATRALRFDDSDRRSRLTRSEVERLHAELSPYRLLLDPVGLTLAHLRFEHAPGPLATAAASLDFRSVEGVSGRVTLGDDHLPVLVETRIPGSVTTTRLQLGDYRAVGTRRVPHELRFETPQGAWTLRVEGIEVNPEE